MKDVSEINSEVNLGTNMDEYEMSTWQWKDLNTSWIWRKTVFALRIWMSSEWNDAKPQPCLFIVNVSWREFVMVLKYKAGNGAMVVQIDWFESSSQLSRLRPQ